MLQVPKACPVFSFLSDVEDVFLHDCNSFFVSGTKLPFFFFTFKNASEPAEVEPAHSLSSSCFASALVGTAN